MRATRLTSARRPAFTLVELLVVIAVITILAGIIMPVILKIFQRSQVVACVNNIGQVMKGINSYGTAWDSQLPCGGTTWWPGSGELWTKYGTDYCTTPDSRCEHPDEPWLDAKSVKRGAGSWSSGKVRQNSPYWYEACIGYINAGVTDAKVLESLQRKGIDSPTRDQRREEMQRLAGVLTCPSKKQAAMGYGYHYAAPFGVDACYPCWPKADRDNNVDVFYTGFKWGRSLNMNDSDPVEVLTWANYPLNSKGNRVPVPVLWYRLSISNSVITNPSAQIALCDAGRVTNDANLEEDPVNWTESSASNLTGYVRFPLCDWYRELSWYKGSTSDSSSNRAWRPVPRHGSKTVSAMFDGSARPIAIREIVNYQWGDGKCLYDNRAIHEPPIPPIIE